MAVYSILPNKNLRGSDIRDTLNSKGGSVTNSVNSFFSKNANINMYSKYKPIPFDIDFLDLTKDQNYKGKNRNCGITIPTFEATISFREALKSGEALWSYTPPRGKFYGEPRRLGDFRNYNSDAINPVGDIEDEYWVVRSGEGDSISVNVELTVDKDAEYNLSLWDLVLGDREIPVEDLYLGLYLERTTGGLKRAYYFRTTEQPIGTDNSFTINFPLDYDESGTFNAYLFLSDVKNPISEEMEQDGYFIGLNTRGKVIRLRKAGSLYELLLSSAMWNNEGTSYHYILDIFNNNSADVTFYSIALQVQVLKKKEDGSYPPDVEENWEVEVGQPSTGTVIYDEYTVSSESSVSLEGDISMTKRDDRKYRIRAICTIPDIIGDYIPFEEEEKDPFE